MIVKLTKIPIMPLASIVSLFHSAVGVILGLIVTVGALFNSENEGFWGLGAWSLIVLPILNAALGFITGVFMGGTYNAIVQWFGQGIEMEMEELDTVSLK